MTTEFNNTITELFKDASKQLDQLVEDAISGKATADTLAVLDNIKNDLHTYSTEVAMLLVRATKEAGVMSRGKYDEIAQHVSGLLSKAKAKL